MEPEPSYIHSNKDFFNKSADAKIANPERAIEGFSVEDWTNPKFYFHHCKSLIAWTAVTWLWIYTNTSKRI